MKNFRRCFFYLLNLTAVCSFGLRIKANAQQVCRVYANQQSNSTPTLSSITNPGAADDATDTTDYSTINVTLSALNTTTAYQNLIFPTVSPAGTPVIVKISGLSATLGVSNQIVIEAYNNSSAISPIITGSTLLAMINNNADSWIRITPQAAYNEVRITISSTLAVGAHINILYAYQIPTSVPAFSVNQIAQCLEGNSFVFSNTSTTNAGTLTYLWDFGDGTTSALTSPAHTYTSAGAYTVKLAATPAGCSIAAYAASAVTVIGGLFTGSLAGLPFYWAGTPGADWGDPANWRVSSSSYLYVPPSVPDASTSVFIGTLPTLICSQTAQQQITISSGTAAQCQNLTLGSNAILKIIGSLTINGNFTDNSGAAYGLQGTATANLTIAGSGSAVSLKFATGYQQLASLSINRSNGASSAVTLASSLAVFNQVNLGANNILDSQNGYLTLKSAQNLTASVNTLPTGAVVKGTVNAERFFYAGGSPTGSANYRSYRLISSPVSNIVYNYNGSQAAAVYNLNYIKAGAILTGAANGNFDKTGNPTLYLFREDVNAGNTSFTAGNYRGITKIDPSSNSIGSQSRFNVANVADTTLQLAAGNGVLFFFRGDRSDFAGKTTAPFSAPQDVVFTNSGVVNQGNIPVKIWFNPTGKLSYTNSSAVKNTGVVGYNLVGNPYPATIDWNSNSAKSTSSPGIVFSVATDVDTKIYVFDPLAKTYNWFDSSIGTSGGNDGNPNVSQYIASGQGFFVRAKNSNATLTFTEAAKVNTQSSQNAPGLLGLPAQAASEPAAVKIQLSRDSANYDYAAVYFQKSWLPAYNADEDAIDLDGNGNNVNLSTFSADQKRLAINKMPALVNQSFKIPLYATGNSGSYALSFPEISNIPAQYRVYLKDNLTQDSVQAENNTTYNFTIDQANAATFGSGRFVLVFNLQAAAAYRLLSFAGKAAGQNFLLSWTTENEGNYTAFTLEKSADRGKNFNPIAVVQANFKGIYSWQDDHPFTGENFFRLKQTDMYGNVTYSDLIELLWQPPAGQGFFIYPNPATSELNIQLTRLQNGLIRSRILNAAGNVVSSHYFFSATLSHSIAALSPGLYVLELYNVALGKIIGTTKFIKN